MNTICPVALTQLNANLLSRTASSMVSLVSPFLADEYVARQVHAINAAQEMLRTLKSTSQASEHTEEIQSVDGEVDALLPVIEDDLVSSVNKKAFFPEQAESAEQLQKLFALRDRTKLFYGGYTDQGEELQTLFKDLFSPDYAEHRSTSGVEPLLNRLKDRVERLNELLELRLGEGNNVTTRKEQRGIIRYRLDCLITYLDSNIADDVGEFRTIHTPINELFTDVMAEYKAGKSRKKSK